jgi:hypothetical protein
MDFVRKTPIFFRRKLSKIAENCDHNIDPPVFFRERIAAFNPVCTYIFYYAVE